MIGAIFGCGCAMREEIFDLLESFVVGQWGRIKFDSALAALTASTSHDRIESESALTAVFSHIAATQQLAFDDLVYAFGKYCFPHFAAKIPRHERVEAHPKKFLMTMHRLLSFENQRKNFAHFHYVDCAPEELLMIYKSKQSFSNFVRGFIDGAAESFSYRIECQPIDIREGEVSGCRFHLRFKGEM